MSIRSWQRGARPNRVGSNAAPRYRLLTVDELLPLRKSRVARGRRHDVIAQFQEQLKSRAAVVYRPSPYFSYGNIRKLTHYCGGAGARKLTVLILIPPAGVFRADRRRAVLSKRG